MAVKTYKAPVISYKPPVSTYKAPAVSAYKAPVITYKAPPAVSTYKAPVSTYTAPAAASTYKAPITSYKPSVAGSVTPTITSYKPAVAGSVTPTKTSYKPVVAGSVTPTITGYKPAVAGSVTPKVISYKPTVAGSVTPTKTSYKPVVAGSVTPTITSYKPAVAGSVTPKITSYMPAVAGSVTTKVTSYKPAVAGSVTPKITSYKPAVTGSVTPTITGYKPAVAGSVTPKITSYKPMVAGSVTPMITSYKPAVAGSVTSKITSYKPVVAGSVTPTITSYKPAVAGSVTPKITSYKPTVAGSVTPPAIKPTVISGSLTPTSNKPTTGSISDLKKLDYDSTTLNNANFRKLDGQLEKSDAVTVKDPYEGIDYYNKEEYGRFNYDDLSDYQKYSVSYNGDVYGVKVTNEYERYVTYYSDKYGDDNFASVEQFVNALAPEWKEAYVPFDEWIKKSSNQKDAVSLGISTAPVVGDVKDAQEAVLGIDLVTGKKIGLFDRAVSGVSVMIPCVSGKLLRNADEAVVLALKSADDIGATMIKYDEVLEPISNNAIKLTRTQQKTIEKLENVIDNNLKEHDFSGTLRDLQGNPVPNPKGGYWDHLTEMKQSYAALNDVKTSLQGSLLNPNLSSADKEILTTALEKASKNIEKIENLFEPYGGIN